MRIIDFAVRNFLSLRDTGPVVLDPAITVLLGKNEHGKTNLLRALKAFDRDARYTVDELCRYSNIRSDVDSARVSPAEVAVASARFELNDEDRALIGEVYADRKKIGTITVTKYLDNHYDFQVGGMTLKAVESRFEEALAHHGPGLREAASTLLGQLEAHAERYEPFRESLPAARELLSAFADQLTELRWETIEHFPETAANIRVTITGLPNQDQPIVDTVAHGLDLLDERVNDFLLAAALSPPADWQLVQLLPRFVYFDDVNVLEDQVAINESLSNRAAHPTLNNLAELAGLDVGRLSGQDSFRRQEATGRASAVITGLVNDSWRQNKVEVSIHADGDDLVMVVRDEDGGHDRPSERSKGFQWYLGFYINFQAGSTGEFKNTVLLLDDPGVYLHASGQKDLLRTIDTLSKNNQFVIATHSPFLIDRDHLERIRIVEKLNERRGTIVKAKWYESQSDAFAPIRAALGMTLADSLALKKRNVVVEGIDDFYIVSGMNRVCQRLKKPFLDGRATSLLPAGGADNVPFWMAILSKERLGAVALLDEDTAGRRARKRMVDDLGVPEDVILTLKGYRAEGMDVEIEDLVEANSYYEAFVRAYRAFFEEQKVPLPELTSLSDSASRIHPYVDYFKSHKLGNFDKTAVANEFMCLCDAPDCSNLVTESDTFGNLFEAIGSALTKAR